MICHYDIDYELQRIKDGFGFYVFQFASEVNIKGSITHCSKNACRIEVEGNSNNIKAFISWLIIEELDSELFETVKITAGLVRNYKEFTINNLSNSQ